MVVSKLCHISGLRTHFSNEYEVTTSGSRIHFSNEYEVTTSGSRIHFSNEYEVTTSVWRLRIHLRIRNVSSSSKKRLGAVNHNLIFSYPQSEVTT